MPAPEITTPLTSDATTSRAAEGSAGRRPSRQAFRRLRRELSPQSQQHNAIAASRHLLVSPILWRRGVVGVYLPSHRDGELDTAALLARLWSMGHKVAAPVISPGADMTFYHLQPDTPLVSNQFGIAEPAPGSRFAHRLSLSVLFVPLVAFDTAGTRLGMGGGYYDRFLGAIPASLRPRVVGLAHEVQRSHELLPQAPWDVGLDDVVTEAGWQSFTRTT